jgi:hypothetical protein
VGHGFTGCGKIPKVSFRGRGLPEESTFFLGLVKKQIPRFARDDIKLLFSAATEAVTNAARINPALAAEVDLALVIASGAKAQVFKRFNVAAEAATHKDHL